MELANIKYITHNDVSVFKNNCNSVPKYSEIKRLEPIIVNDSLMLSTETENVALLSDYIKKNYLLVPIRRKNNNKQIQKKHFPSRILLEITSKCNLKCTMCPRNFLKRPEIHMPKEIVFRCIDEIDHFGVEGLWLYNLGEFSLHPDFKEILNYCQTKKRLGSIWISTNGQELTDEIMDLLINSNITFLNYSLNAMSSQSYNLISPNGNYGRLVSNLEKLIAKKEQYKKVGSTPYVRIQMIDQPQVFPEIDTFISEYSKKSEILSINLLEGFSQNVPQNIDYAKQREREVIKYCNRIQRGDCFIFSNGEVSFCDTDFNGVNSLGNIFSSSIQEVWSNFERIEEINLEGRIEELPLCKNCLDWDL